MSAAPTRPARPVPIDTSSLAGLTRDLLRGTALLVLPVALIVTLAVSEVRIWGSLTRDGIRAPAEVVGGRSWWLSDRLRIAFATPDGRLIEASVPVENVSRYALGSTVDVAYDRTNPRRVRTVNDWYPPYVALFGVAAILGLIALLVLWRAWRWPRRLRRVAEHVNDRHPMVLSSVSVPGRVTASWAVLRERGLPPDGPPQLAFRLIDAGVAPVQPVDVDVVGKRRRRTVGFVTTSTGVIWPAGKMRPPPRAVCRAVERARTGPEVGGTDGAPRSGLAKSGLYRDQLQLPPDLVTKVPRVGGAKLLLTLAPVLLAVTVPFVLPEVIESHRHTCPSPPTAGAGETGLLPVDALASSLPTSLAGYRRADEAELGIPAFSNPATATALVNAGFTSGFKRNFLSGQVSVKLEVFQFATELGPLRYEAQRLTSLCAFEHQALQVPAGSGVSGAVIQGPERPIHRLTFVRGNRDYIVSIDGFRVTGEAEILNRLLDTAK